MDDLNLSTDQTEKILQYQDLTGIENIEICRDVLQRHGWDLEVAVQDQLNMSEGRPSLYASEHAPPTVVNDGIIQHVFYNPPSGSIRGGPFGYIVQFVFQFCYNTLTSILKFAFSFLRKDTRRAVTDPVGDVLKFIDHFNEAYGRNHPVFYQGSYSQALNDAKQELRFLLIYLHKDANQDCINFCRDTLTQPEISNYINNNNMLMWGCNTASGEGNAVSQTLKPGGYPFLAVIVLKESRMSLVGRMEGPASSTELLSRLGAIVSSNVSYLDSARSERIARSLNQIIRREQDAAYMESLRADQEKQRKKCEEEERKRKIQEEERERIYQEQLRKEAIRKAKVDLVSDVPPEPESSNPEVICVVFKMPSGERIERRFLRTHTLKDVYNYVFCHPSSPDSFEIATNFPKRTLQCETEPQKTLIEAGLGKSEVLFVYDLEA